MGILPAVSSRSLMTRTSERKLSTTTGGALRKTLSSFGDVTPSRGGPASWECCANTPEDIDINIKASKDWRNCWCCSVFNANFRITAQDGVEFHIPQLKSKHKSVIAEISIENMINCGSNSCYQPCSILFHPGWRKMP